MSNSATWQPSPGRPQGTFREIGLTGVDAATVLGVSAQRVSQLAKS